MSAPSTAPSTALTVGVVKERAPGERRVACVPDVVPRLTALGAHVLVESGAGLAAWHDDEAYALAGADVVPAATLDTLCDVVLCVQAPPPDRLAGGPAGRVVAGRVVAGLLDPSGMPERVQVWADLGLTTLALERLPRTLSRAQSMDALTSQAGIAGYKAAVVAAAAYGGWFPMMTTAAGTARPARVLVLGAGVAGLAALATARRLGAVVTGYDVRTSAAAEVRSLGAAFLDLSTEVAADGSGGYARELTAAERAAQQDALQEAVGRFDVVITTAAVPGARAPVLVTGDGLKAMRPGSVVVDLAARDGGGNVEGSVPEATVVLGAGVTVIGAGALAGTVPAAASAAYARNLSALLAHLVVDGVLTIDPADEITGALLVTHGGTRTSSGEQR